MYSKNGRFNIALTITANETQRGLSRVWSALTSGKETAN